MSSRTTLDTKSLSPLSGSETGHLCLSLFASTATPIRDERVVDAAIVTMNQHISNLPEAEVGPFITAIEGVPHLLEFVLCVSNDNAFTSLAQAVVQNVPTSAEQFLLSTAYMLLTRFSSSLETSYDRASDMPPALIAHRWSTKSASSALLAISRTRACGTSTNGKIAGGAAKSTVEDKRNIEQHDQTADSGTKSVASSVPAPSVFQAVRKASKTQGVQLAEQIIRNQIESLQYFLNAFRDTNTAAFFKRVYMLDLGVKSGEDQGTERRFSSLVDRSIQAWGSLNYVGQERDSAIERHSAKLRRLTSVDDLLDSREYWFFQLRSAFLQQGRLTKWDSERMDEYILLPIDYGFVNNTDCYFVSHFWRTAESPDPDGVDLRLFVEDLKGDTQWSYIWTDWTCMPQGHDGKRTEREKWYFKMMLQCIPMLVRDCAFEWRFPSFQPRAWILYEVAEYVLTHTQYVITDDIRPFIDHIREMVCLGVGPVLKRYGYKCTNDSDMSLVTGWLEILVIMTRIFPDDAGTRQEILDILNRPYVGTFSNPLWGIEIDKTKGVVRYKGQTHQFTPMFHITSSISSSRQ